MENNTLLFTAQMIMDLYYQSLKAEEDYFELQHFVFAARAVFGKLLETEAERARQYAKAEQGVFVITLSQDWLISEKVTFQKSGRQYQGKLSQMPFGFPYDQMGYAVQSLEPLEGSETEYIRISPEAKWTVRHLPTTRKTMYYVQGQYINLVNRQQISASEDCLVWYAPSLTGDPQTSIVPSGKQLDVVTYSLQLMKQAATGAVVDTSNNQNPNQLIQSEIDKAALK